MREINYVELENGMRILTNNPSDKKMDMLEIISRDEFLEKFPNHPYAYNYAWDETYLENGVVLLSSEWNGYEYHSDGKTYRPVYQLCENGETDDIYSDEAEFDYVGYYETY